MESTSMRLTRLRGSKGLTERELSEKLGIDAEAYSSWENGKELPDTESSAKLAKFYGITQTELIYGKDARMASMTVFPKEATPQYSLFADIRVFVCAAVMFVGLGGILYMIMAAVAAGNTDVASIFAFAKLSFTVFGAMFVFGAALGGVILKLRSSKHKRKKQSK